MKVRRTIGALALTAVATATVGCSLPEDSGPQAIASEDVPEGLRADSPDTTQPGPGANTRTVYFLDGQEEPQLVPFEREVEEDAGVEDVLELLLVDPDEAEEPTRIPAGVALASDLTISENTLRIDLEGIDELTGPARQLAFAQIVLTVTQFDAIEQVVFETEGEPTAVPDGEGVERDLVGCGDYEDLLADGVPSPCD